MCHISELDMTFSPQEKNRAHDISICLVQARLLTLCCPRLFLFVLFQGKSESIGLFPFFSGGLKARRPQKYDLSLFLIPIFLYVRETIWLFKNFKKNLFSNFPCIYFSFCLFFLCRHHKSDWSEGHIDSTASSKAIDTIAISSQGWC